MEVKRLNEKRKKIRSWHQKTEWPKSAQSKYLYINWFHEQGSLYGMGAPPVLWIKHGTPTAGVIGQYKGPAVKA